MAAFAENGSSPARTRHYLLFGTDICGYSRCDQSAQIQLRDSSFKIFQEACRSACIPPRLCRVEDRGDGLLMVADSKIGLEAVFPTFINSARAGVREHNARLARKDSRMRLRMALHAGFLHRDAHGFSGDAVNHLSRLLDAPAFKDRMAEHGAAFAVIVSADLYHDAASFHLIDPRIATPIDVNVKETRSRAWMLTSCGGR
ncbi:hypothetical protein E1298_09840 [Actinomadura rubrisoli]|uniref:Guanylate cyclase domain-containing protein n=2 Tax=Actinomadura rubrisoli TaxID=2530368 RepID=A0A4R5C434_9ACTN|nr:hypothetical protein E1298_09840 [Actinomadura rubrisoli]